MVSRPRAASPSPLRPRRAAEAPLRPTSLTPKNAREALLLREECRRLEESLLQDTPRLPSTLLQLVMRLPVKGSSLRKRLRRMRKAAPPLARLLREERGGVERTSEGWPLRALLHAEERALQRAEGACSSFMRAPTPSPAPSRRGHPLTFFPLLRPPSSTSCPLPLAPPSPYL